jgi:hypothetical protein
MIVAFSISASGSGQRVAAGEREPLRPAFPLKTVPWWFPGLFPGDVEQRLNQ